MANRAQGVRLYLIGLVCRRRGLSAFGRLVLASGSLAHMALVLLSLAATASVFTAPAMAQSTYCQPAGSTNCGACNVNNGLIACMTLNPATGNQLTTFTDLNTGAQSVLAVQKPDSTTHACPSGYTAQGDGSCSVLSQTQGNNPVGNSANLTTPDLGCTTTNGVTNCSGCTIGGSRYICKGTDQKTGAQFTSQTDLATGYTYTNRELAAPSGACPSGYIKIDSDECSVVTTSQSSPLLQSVTAPPAPPKPVTPPPITPPPPTTPVTPPTTPVKTTTPVTMPTKPNLTAAQEKQKALAEAQRKKVATDPKAAAAALKRDQFLDKKAETRNNTKAETKIEAREKLEKSTLVKDNPKLLKAQTLAKTVKLPVKQVAVVKPAVKAKVILPVKTKCAPDKCAR